MPQRRDERHWWRDRRVLPLPKSEKPQKKAKGSLYRQLDLYTCAAADVKQSFRGRASASADAGDRRLGRDALDFSFGGPSTGVFGGGTGRNGWTGRGLGRGAQAAAVAEVEGGRVAGGERLDGSFLDKIAEVLANCAGLAGSSRSFSLSRFRHIYFDARRAEWESKLSAIQNECGGEPRGGARWAG